MTPEQHLDQIETLLDQVTSMLLNQPSEIDQRYALRRLRRAHNLLEQLLQSPALSEKPKRSTPFGIADGKGSFRSLGLLHLWPNGTVTWSELDE